MVRLPHGKNSYHVTGVDIVHVTGSFLLKAHPRLTPEHLRAALLYAAALVELDTTVTP